MAELKKLNIKKGAFLRSLQAFVKFLDRADIQEIELNERCERITVMWEDYGNVNVEIECLLEADTDVKAHIERFENSEKLYYEVLAKAKQNLRLFRVQEQMNHTIQAPTTAVKVKLPTISVHQFSGEYDQWLSFKDSYTKAVHNQQDIPKVQKFQILKGLLKDDALKIISALEATDDNYEEAWELLRKRYSNHRIIINTHLKGLFDLPTVSRTNTSTLRNVIDTTRTHLRSLKTLGEPTDNWDTIIIYIITNKLDRVTREDWEKEVDYSEEAQQPKLDELMKFLEKRYLMLEISDHRRSGQDNSQTTSNKKDKKVALTATTSIQQNTAKECVCCSGQHSIYRCEQFLKLQPDQRYHEAIRLRLCINCLKQGHFGKDCRSQRCKTCGLKHNSLLHKDKNKKEESKVEDSSIIIPGQANYHVSNHCAPRKTDSVLLSTVQVYISDNEGKQHICRALLDGGSQVNLLTEEFEKKLKIHVEPIRIPVSTLNESNYIIQRSVQVTMRSTTSSYTAQLKCLVLPKITQRLPQTFISLDKLIIPQGIELADPTFNKPGKIDMLIGAALFWKILKKGDNIQVKGQPCFQGTELGWIVGGELDMTKNKQAVSRCLLLTEGLEAKVEQFWKIEEVPTQKKKQIKQDYCETHYNETHKRDHEGRFIVELPKDDNIKLGDSFEQALRRFKALEQRLERDPEMKKAYVEFMRDYERKEHMTPTQEQEDGGNESYYIPHQAVCKKTSLTTKLRVVFDASAKTSLGTSLNDKLLPGPNLQNDLRQILIRFRFWLLVMTADVKQMFRQILVAPLFRHLQKILWRENPNEAIKVYTLNTVTQGTVNAPFLAMRCLKQTSKEAKVKFPRAADAIKDDFYMDDFLSGADALKEAIELQKQVTAILEAGKFPLRKWRANDPRILQHIKDSGKTDDLLVLDEEASSKTLGVLWDSKKDVLLFRINSPEADQVSKRQILSSIAQIYDPLGVLGPVIVNAKLIMQDLWKLKIGWDEDIPEDLRIKWITFSQSLKQLEELEVKRHVCMGNSDRRIVIHGFADASERAYGACIYVTTMENGNVPISSLLCSKSKVAPLKILTLPKLELSAALLLARLVSNVLAALDREKVEVNLWSDSAITLYWIQTPPSNLKTFVANRVAEIQELTQEYQWRHVPTAENPADYISRGVAVEKLITLNHWWDGPTWINSTDEWPEQRLPSIEIPERKIVNTLTITHCYDILRRYSSLGKLQRVIAYCVRFIDMKIGKKIIQGPLTVKELDEAQLRILRMTQGEAFTKELADLSKKREISKKSSLLSLNPFLDIDGLLKVGGRLRHAEISQEQKHPIILPSSHHITELILKSEHERLLHCGPRQLLYAVRQRYWPLSGGREVRKLTRRCIPCFKLKPKGTEVIMGDLPEPRVNPPIFPFQSAGVDYAGPIRLRESKRRGKVHESKSYIAVFVCLASKAVHLELVSDLTTEAFLAAFKRFIARRGLCKTIYSDNGTTFQGAARELKKIQEFISTNENELRGSLASSGVGWEFIPPRTPHFGGLWESAVKSVKKHLYTVTKGLLCTFEELCTLLAQIESVLNSRPLMPMSENVDDLDVLTPSHFLIGIPHKEVDSRQFLDVPDNRLSRWQLIQKVRQHFWKRWSNEYLQQLQERLKWTVSAKSFDVGTMVIMKEDNQPPLRWNLARIIATYPGYDGVVRVVDVRTKDGVFRRSVHRLCILPFDQKI